MKLMGLFYFRGHMSPRPLGLLFIVPALLFIEDHEEQDKFSHVHRLVALLMQCTSLADQKGADQARMDVLNLGDRRGQVHMFVLRIFPCPSDHL